MIAEATVILEGEGFIIEERIEEPSDEFEKGQVIRTDPEAGKKHDFGSSVLLYVSIGKEDSGNRKLYR